MEYIYTGKIDGRERWKMEREDRYMEDIESEYREM